MPISWCEMRSMKVAACRNRLTTISPVLNIILKKSSPIRFTVRGRTESGLMKKYQILGETAGVPSFLGHFRFLKDAANETQ